jgi:hypothetical protein
MTLEQAAYWDRFIQPEIRQFPKRADYHWRWREFWAVLPLVQRLKGRSCVGWTTLVANDEREVVPAAMSLLIEHYPHLPVGTDQTSVFTWFIAAAPEAALQKRGVRHLPSLGRILVDTALVSSLALGTQGRMGLHCARAGGTRLYDFYLNKCGLMPMKRQEKLSIRRANDGRFFYTNELRALHLMRQLSRMRYP